MAHYQPRHGITTLACHAAEKDNSAHAHVTPIYQTSTFNFPDVATGVAIWKGEQPGYIYTRLSNPNLDELASRIAYLEGFDLIRQQPERDPAQNAALGKNTQEAGSLRDPDEVVAGRVCSSGMAAITSAILARVKGGDTVIAQESIYSASYLFLHDLAPQYGIRTVWLHDPSLEAWEAAFRENPRASLAYVESPSNPRMRVVDLRAIVEIAHRHGAWVMADNTFATPYCQRPLALGLDVILHSTTKYLSGHGQVIGGAVVSTHTDFMRNEFSNVLRTLGGTPSPFDAWLAATGLKTFELRMQRHCENAMAVARYLEKHPKVAEVFYPGLESFPGHAIAESQMLAYGGMMSFELAGGLAAGEALMNHVRLATLAVSLGTVDTLIEHPASMTHMTLTREAREAMGITDGLVRFSVGIENVEDIIDDLEQALKYA